MLYIGDDVVRLSERMLAFLTASSGELAEGRFPFSPQEVKELGKFFKRQMPELSEIADRVVGQRFRGDVPLQLTPRQNAIYQDNMVSVSKMTWLMTLNDPR
eukprot:gene10473-1321_t